uniref:Unconventional myosin-Ie n=1 Tax=Rhabditophanes sp. KR3021 TaxID=114890 RepID=A0AC35TFU4_9BILA
MPYHWQSKVNVQNAGVDDMVLLNSLTNEAIVDNLKKRLKAKGIFTYIGPVLISVNPFKEMGCFTDREIEQYQGANQYENPPHIYALADNMYRNMMIDNEKQCVIISGESGAGKTVIAKHVMNYMAKVSGGGQKVQKIKDVIIQSNPLLEAFGNSSTLRNWNSSRFGKYIEIIFGKGGQPVGGKISNFLLEKSRVVSQMKGERNFHVFYQLLHGAEPEMKRNFGLTNVDYFTFLNQSGCSTIEGTDDRREYKETIEAMSVIGIAEQVQIQILQLLSAVLHIGNIEFVEEDNFGQVQNDQQLEFPAFLLGLTASEIENKITQRVIETKRGNSTETIQVKLNVEQARYARDAWAKAIYSRLFDFLVKSINEAFSVTSHQESTLSIGILDIYGFEIFDNNGYSQFCINYVNEKLQQIFIELTLKAEQEEYLSEGIQWIPIEYFNNKVVCDLIESKKPPGVMCILDDICAQMHGQSEGVDNQFLNKLASQVSMSQHFFKGASSFIIKHYAGDVSYETHGFCEQNRDVLNQDVIALMQTSDVQFYRQLFPEDVSNMGAKSKPTSFSSKIKTQANQLVDSLMKCTPHYVRCIKPNESKRALEFEQDRVMHQVQYLGLHENIRVRRAGFAYRRQFEKFLWRYAILTSKTWPKWNGDPKKGCEIICESVNMSEDQYQLGRTKIFIKNPESLFLLEEMRERKYDRYARTIQKAFKKFTAAKRHMKMKEEACDLMFGKKERRRLSVNRNFVGDYVGLQNRPALQVIAGRREKIEFAVTLNKYDRKFRTTKLDVLVTHKELILIGKELEKQGINKGKIIDVVKRRLQWADIESICLSPFQDNFVIVMVVNEFGSLLETPLKTEMITAMEKRYKERMNGRGLPLVFRHNYELKFKKLKFFGASNKHVQYALDNNASGDTALLKVSSKGVLITVGSGLPNNTRPSNVVVGAKLPKIAYTKHNNNKQQNGHIRNHHPENSYSVFSGTNVVQPVNNPTEYVNVEPVKAPARPPKPQIAAKPKIPYCLALYYYEAQDTTELTFDVNQKIELIEKHESGWWLGRINNKTGLFPANYVEEL